MWSVGGQTMEKVTMDFDEWPVGGQAMEEMVVCRGTDHGDGGQTTETGDRPRRRGTDHGDRPRRQTSGAAVHGIHFMQV